MPDLERIDEELARLPTRRDVALFLDIDGTLAELESDPADVRIPDGIPESLKRLHSHGAAIAILSGRPMADVVRLLPGLPIALVGSHGAEVMLPSGRSLRSPVKARLRGYADSFERATAYWEGVFVERKPYSVAVHYRGAPDEGPAVQAMVRRAVSRHPYEVQRLPGCMVEELLPIGIDKGRALRVVTGIGPYKGRTPYAVGDDITDEAAYQAAVMHGGAGVSVGPRRSPLARWHLGGPATVGAWLRHGAAMAQAVA